MRQANTANKAAKHPPFGAVAFSRSNAMRRVPSPLAWALVLLCPIGFVPPRAAPRACRVRCSAGRDQIGLRGRGGNREHVAKSKAGNSREAEVEFCAKFREIRDWL